MTSPSILRCSTATKTSSAVVGQLQVSRSNSYHYGICISPTKRDVLDNTEQRPKHNSS